MKTLKFKGRNLQYLRDSFSIHGGVIYQTHFYEGNKIITKRRFGIIGPKIKVEVPNYIFTIEADCNNPKLNKLWWNKKIEKKLKLYERDKNWKSLFVTQVF